MKIKFESHEDYALACKVLSSLVEDSKKFEEMVDLFFAASEELGAFSLKIFIFLKVKLKLLRKTIKFCGITLIYCRIVKVLN